MQGQTLTINLATVIAILMFFVAVTSVAVAIWKVKVITRNYGENHLKDLREEFNERIEKSHCSLKGKLDVEIKDLWKGFNEFKTEVGQDRVESARTLGSLQAEVKNVNQECREMKGDIAKLRNHK